MPSNRLYNSATPSKPSALPAALELGNSRARAIPTDVITVLSADCATPILFSRARLFRKPSYAVFAELRHKRALGGDYVLFTLARLNSGVYDLDSPVYESSCYEDVLDVWSLFEAG